MDLYNREIIGYSAGANKDKYIVYKAFANVKYPLDNINILHTDRGNEFKNSMIDNLLKTFSISRSLSKKGCPYDNAVAEATFKIIKTEFVFNRIFKSFEELETSLFDYVNWYNKFRVHSSLGYLSPIEYKAILSEKKLDQPWHVSNTSADWIPIHIHGSHFNSPVSTRTKHWPLSKNPSKAI